MKRVLFVLMAAALVTAGQAAVVSYNFDNNGTVGGDGAGSLPPLEARAGAVLAGGWTNDWPDYNFTDVRDDSGNATTLDIAPASNSGTWATGGFFHPGQDADGSWNKEMLNGYLNGTGVAGASIVLTEIPYAVYDIYVYVASDDATRQGTVTDGTTTYSFGILDGMLAGADALLVQTTDTTGAFPEANYAVFSGLTGASQTISTNFEIEGQYGGIAAIQVVEVPEPATMALLGLGSLVMFRKRQ